MKLNVHAEEVRFLKKNFVRILSERRQQCQTGIKLKSLILAQIERWRHALHMQVERQHGCLHLMASGERVSKISERTVERGIT